MPPAEAYTDERIAQFTLNNSVDARDYASAREQVRQLGLDPDRIDHDPPVGVK